MQDASDMARLAALIGDPARARMLTSLMSGMALTATELALEADVAPSTASSHLAKLADARLLTVERQGKHRYFRLAGEDVADVLERLMGTAARMPLKSRIGPSDPALRRARVCYDHLAGEQGVWLFERLDERKLLAAHDNHELFATLGIDVAALARGRRPLVRPCLDWSERRHHLGGALGAAILDRIFARRWARREPDSRAVTFTPTGASAFRRLFEGRG